MILVHVNRETPTWGARILPATTSMTKVQKLAMKTTTLALTACIGRADGRRFVGFFLFLPIPLLHNIKKGVWLGGLLEFLPLFL